MGRRSGSGHQAGQDIYGMAAAGEVALRRVNMTQWLGVVVILLLTSATMGAMSMAASEPAPPQAQAVVDDEPIPPFLLQPATPESKGFVPRQVRIPKLGVEARIKVMGTDAQGEMELPDDPQLISWWRGSARAGASEGNVVVAGHVYQRDYGYGALWELAELEPGDRIVVLGSKDRRLRYAVKSVEATKKVDFAAPKIFSDSGPQQLVVITCGGYNRATDHYEDNVIVTAVPL